MKTTLLSRRLGPPGIGRPEFENPVHALQHVAAMVAGDRDDALQPEDVVAARLQKLCQMRVEALLVEARIEDERHRIQRWIVLVMMIVEEVLVDGHRA